MRFIPGFLKLALAKWGVKQAVKLGFDVLPTHRSAAAQFHAEQLEQLVRAKGPQFRNRELRSRSLTHLSQVKGNLDLGRAEVEIFLKEGGTTD